MGTTNMEELHDLEVAIWVQNPSTKEIYNSRFAYEYTDHVYPAQNLNVTTIGDDPKLKLSWEKPEGNMQPDGYNIIIDGQWVEENFKGLSFTDEASTLNIYDGLTHYVEIVAVYSNNRRSVSLIGKINDILNVEEMTADNKCNIYPNPANDRLYIEAESEINDVVIYNVYGRVQNLRNSETQKLRISVDLSNLNAGVYFIKINTNEGNIVKQFIKR